MNCDMCHQDIGNNRGGGMFANGAIICPNCLHLRRQEGLQLKEFTECPDYLLLSEFVEQKYNANSVLTKNEKVIGILIIVIAVILIISNFIIGLLPS